MIIAIINKNKGKKSLILIIYKIKKIVYNTYAMYEGLKRQAYDAHSVCQIHDQTGGGSSAAM